MICWKNSLNFYLFLLILLKKKKQIVESFSQWQGFLFFILFKNCGAWFIDGDRIFDEVVWSFQQCWQLWNFFL